MNTSPDPLPPAIQLALTHPDALCELSNIYTTLATRTATRKPLCTASGRCCHFDSYGHRLYVTTLELASFSQSLQSPPLSPSPGTRGEGRGEGSAHNSLPILPLTRLDACPFQLNNLCSVHPIRPFGCRVFFCDPTATDWQQDQYESLHAQIKQLHDQYQIPYLYVEWRDALSRLGLSNSPAPL